MRLTIKKVMELPENLEGDTLYLTGSDERDLLVAWMTNTNGAVIKHTPLRSGMRVHGTTLIDNGAGVYTINCAIQPAVYHLPRASGSQDVRIFSFINANSLLGGALLSNGSDTLNGLTAPYLTNEPTTVVLIDAAQGQWVVSALGGVDAIEGPQGERGPQGPIGGPGYTGSQGGTGPQGAVGTQGSAGSNGLVGATGGTGAQGARGAQGFQGAIGQTGIGGAAGANGAQGAPGINGTGQTYIHEQILHADVWVVQHNLNAFLNCTVVDATGKVIDCEIVYTDSNTITVTHSYTLSGRVFVS